MAKEFKTTNRGFKIYGELKDTQDGELDLIESSIVGRPQLRMYAYDRHKAPEATYSSCTTLTVEKAKELIELLQGFVDDAESPDNWRNDPEYEKNWG